MQKVSPCSCLFCWGYSPDLQLKKFVTISSRASIVFQGQEGIKLRSLAWTLNLSFLFLLAFLSTSFDFSVRFYLFLRYLNVSLTLKSCSSCISLMKPFSSSVKSSQSSNIWGSLVYLTFYSYLNKILKVPLLCWHLDLTLSQLEIIFLVCPC